MSSTARQKVDRQTMSLFDPEVERPDHDRILTTLYEDQEALEQTLADLHDLKPLMPFSSSDRFAVHDENHHSADGKRADVVSLDDAVQMTGVPPSWSSLSPVRIERKRLEVLMHLWSSERSSRLIGFVDMCVRYRIVHSPTLWRENGKVFWQTRGADRMAMIEVKGQWPSTGALIRQLNLYSACTADGFDATHSTRDRIVVGPDDSVHSVVSGHGYRLVTFSGAPLTFRVSPAIRRPETKPVPGVF
ncbi:MAG TPA: hypothetical protein PK306_05510 [Aquabacterium sp.]|nr:hypothetical protein [Aquabacterium sp.]